MTSSDKALNKMLTRSRPAPPTRLPVSSMPKVVDLKAVAAEVPEERIPTTLDDLGQQRNHCYDLSLSAATELGIPIFGSASGHYSRRVVVLERSAYKGIRKAGTTYNYGWAVRINVSVTNKKGEIRASLPWLAASAQLGLMEAAWGLEVLGLTGTVISEAISPPKELTVEAYVEAKQSLDLIIKAIRDPSTRFLPHLIAVDKSESVLHKEYVVGAARSYALAQIGERRTLHQALQHVAQDNDVVRDAIKDTYVRFAKITDPAERPTDTHRSKARELLGRLRCVNFAR